METAELTNQTLIDMIPGKYFPDEFKNPIFHPKKEYAEIYKLLSNFRYSPAELIYFKLEIENLKKRREEKKNLSKGQVARPDRTSEKVPPLRGQ